MKKENGRQSVQVITRHGSFDAGSWLFCQNGYQSTGVDVSVEQFDMLKEIISNPEVVAFYEELRNKTPLAVNRL